MGRLAMTSGAQRLGELAACVLHRASRALEECTVPAAKAALEEFTSSLSAAHHMQLSAALSSRPSQSSLFARLTELTAGKDETEAEDVTESGISVLGEKKKACKAKVLAAYEMAAEAAARAAFWGELSQAWLKKSSASSMPLHDSRQFVIRNRDAKEESIQWQAWRALRRVLLLLLVLTPVLVSDWCVLGVRLAIWPGGRTWRGGRRHDAR